MRHLIKQILNEHKPRWDWSRHEEPADSRHSFVDPNTHAPVVNEPVIPDHIDTINYINYIMTDKLPWWYGKEDFHSYVLKQDGGFIYKINHNDDETGHVFAIKYFYKKSINKIAVGVVFTTKGKREFKKDVFDTKEDAMAFIVAIINDLWT